MSAPGLSARRAAARMLQAVTQDGRMVTSFGAELRDLPPADRARAQSLCGAALRNLGRIDAVLVHFINREPDPRVLNILRIAVTELMIEGTPAHAAVDMAVRATRGNRKTASASGMVNAVLRKVDADGRAMWPDLPANALPDWIDIPLTEELGEDTVNAIVAAQAEVAPIDLTVKSDPEGWATKLGGEALPSGTVRLKGRPQITKLEGFKTGDWWVQDAAAAMPAKLLGDLTGKLVLDVCAAPGGKTMQLANAGARMVALDISAPRIKRLRENLKRTGLRADVVAKDVLQFKPNKQYDAILLDAPCSATGTLRRHPDLPFIKGQDTLEALTSLQSQMLEHLSDYLASGGDMIFCTCSLLAAEGRERVDELLSKRSDIVRVPIDPAQFGGDATWDDGVGGLRLRPDLWADKGGMDGFRITHLRKV